MDEKPAKAWVWYFIGMVVVIGVALIMLGTGTAHAQEQPICAPAEVMLRQFSEIHKERPIWEGVVPHDTAPRDANPSLADKGV